MSIFCIFGSLFPKTEAATILFKARTTTGFATVGTVAMNTVLNNPEDILNTGTNKLIIPRDGFYKISSTLGLTGGTGSENRLSFNRTTPGSPFFAYLIRVSNTASGTFQIGFTDYLILRAGDVVYWEFYPIGGTRGINGAVENLFTIEELNNE